MITLANPIAAPGAQKTAELPKASVSGKGAVESGVRAPSDRAEHFSSPDMTQMLDDMQNAQLAMKTEKEAPKPKESTPPASLVGSSGVRRKPEDTNVYLVGGGIASLAAAVILLRDAKVPGKNIHILEENKLAGGSLDASGTPAEGYLMRGGRMFEEHYQCTKDLLSAFPSLEDPNKTALQDMVDAYPATSWDDKCRLIDKNGKKIEIKSMGFNNRDRWDMLKLTTFTSEKALGKKRIDEVFHPHFFETNFWAMWSSMFSFETWHSAAEMKRYLLRFMQDFSQIGDLKCIQATKYNNYDSIVRPMLNSLVAQGVDFVGDTQVTDLGLNPPNSAQTVDRIRYKRGGQESDITLGKNDVVIVTNGSMTAGSTEGNMDKPAVLNTGDAGGSWNLWKKLATQRPEFGNPNVFCGNIDKSKWESFTVTIDDPEFVKKFNEFTGTKESAKGGLLTFKESNWGLTVGPLRNHFYPNQPADKYVWWGYGLFPDKEGDTVKKKMADCNGKEILTEVCNQLHFDQATADSLIKNSKCRMAMMPYITSQFMPREKGDRPDVIPKGTNNLAFVGQYSEMPDDTVFTVEYSVRSAMEAVYNLLGVDKSPPPVYKGQHDLGVVWNAVKTSFS